MVQWAKYVGSLNMPQIEKVDEIEQWIVWMTDPRDGKRKGHACSSEDIAKADVAYYEREGYQDISIEKRIVPLMGERPW